MRDSDPRDEAGDLRPAELGMSDFDLVQAAVGHPSEIAPRMSRLVQQIPLDIPVVADHRGQNKSPLPTGMSFIVSHQPLSCRPAAGLHVRKNEFKRHTIMSEELEKRVELLSNLVESIAGQEMTRAKHGLYVDADFHTLKLILTELCFRLGTTPEMFDAHYEAVRVRCLAAGLNAVSHISKNLAGRLDVRSDSEIDGDEPLPLLFPE